MRAYVAGMDARARRMALNQAMFRIANERVSAWPERRVTERTVASSFYCECSRTSCRDRLNVRLADYEAVRGNSRRFVIARGHEYTEIERVVEDHGVYVVVEKLDEAAEVVEATDPRRG